MVFAVVYVTLIEPQSTLLPHPARLRYSRFLIIHNYSQLRAGCEDRAACHVVRRIPKCEAAFSDCIRQQTAPFRPAHFTRTAEHRHLRVTTAVLN